MRGKLKDKQHLAKQKHSFYTNSQPQQKVHKCFAKCVNTINICIQFLNGEVNVAWQDIVKIKQTKKVSFYSSEENCSNGRREFSEKNSIIAKQEYHSTHKTTTVPVLRIIGKTNPVIKQCLDGLDGKNQAEIRWLFSQIA